VINHGGYPSNGIYRACASSCVTFGPSSYHENDRGDPVPYSLDPYPWSVHDLSLAPYFSKVYLCRVRAICLCNLGHDRVHDVDPCPSWDP
jgi:hypothetical protein